MEWARRTGTWFRESRGFGPEVGLGEGVWAGAWNWAKSFFI
jgi:hypothetical protein